MSKEQPKLRSTKTDESVLTLDFDGKLVTPENFRRAINSFVDLLKEVSDDICGNGKRIQWNMKVASGSRLVIAQPVADLKTKSSAKQAADAIFTGLKLLEKGSKVVPEHFTDRALKAARELACLQDRHHKTISYIRIRVGKGRKNEISENAAQNIDKLLGGQHQAIGSIEGRLQTISERGTLQFVVFDSLFDKGVNCFIEGKMAAQAIAAFGKRVSVSGVVQYDRESRPVSIKVDTVRILKDAKDLPPIKSLRGIFTRTG